MVLRVIKFGFRHIMIYTSDSTIKLGNMLAIHNISPASSPSINNIIIKKKKYKNIIGDMIIAW